VPFAQIPAREHPQHLLRKFEQPQPVRNRWLRPPDAIGDIAERELELVHEGRVRARFLDGRKLLTRNVLNEAEKKGVAILYVADDRGKRGNSSRLRRAPAPLAGDELESSLGPPPYHDGLEHPLQADGARKTGSRLRLETTAWLARVGVNRLDGEME
jgi:hypothetical protein